MPESSEGNDLQWTTPNANRRARSADDEDFLQRLEQLERMNAGDQYLIAAMDHVDCTPEEADAARIAWIARREGLLGRVGGPKPSGSKPNQRNLRKAERRGSRSNGDEPSSPGGELSPGAETPSNASPPSARARNSERSTTYQDDEAAAEASPLVEASDSFDKATGGANDSDKRGMKRVSGEGDGRPQRRASTQTRAASPAESPGLLKKMASLNASGPGTPRSSKQARRKGKR